MKMNQLTLGNDPELFLRNNKTGEIVSAIPFINEGKDNPRQLGKGFQVLHDNALIEFGVPPSKGKKQFIETLREGLRRVRKVVGKNHDLLAQASHVFDDKFLQDQDARVFGCSAEFDAWERCQCQPPDARTNLRSAGSHIHVGRSDWQNASDDILMNPLSKMETIKLMDIFVGIPMMILEGNDPTTTARKKLYGKASRHRPCDYGVEYRVLSPYWLRSPKLAGLVYDLTNVAVQTEVDQKAESVLQLFKQDEIVDTINTANVRNAKKLLKRIPLDKKLKTRIAALAKQKFPAVVKW